MTIEIQKSIIIKAVNKAAMKHMVDKNDNFITNNSLIRKLW